MRRNKGFTLIEAMVAIAILAILVAVAMPAMGTAQANARIRSASADVMSALADARAQAIGLQRNVTLKANGGAWQKGWEMKRSVAVNGLQAIAAHHGLPTTIELTADPALTELEFLPTGLVQQTDGKAIDELKFTVCDSVITTEIGRDITLSRLGRVQMSTHADASVCEGA